METIIFLSIITVLVLVGIVLSIVLIKKSHNSILESCLKSLANMSQNWIHTKRICLLDDLTDED